jgi:hypothetical protein
LQKQILLLSVLFLAGCAAPIHELWPPREGQRSVTIIVSLDTWHAMIAMPIEPKSAATTPLYEEWGYAERAWYLEGRQGSTGVIRALFWPTEGVVEVARYDRIWAERTPQPPADLFAFNLSEIGYHRLRDYLSSTIASPTPLVVSGQSHFYLARKSYHLFHHCHQYAARALREAGLPIFPPAAISRGAFAEQLKRAQRLGRTGNKRETHLSGGTSTVMDPG